MRMRSVRTSHEDSISFLKRCHPIIIILFHLHCRCLRGWTSSFTREEEQKEGKQNSSVFLKCRLECQVLLTVCVEGEQTVGCPNRVTADGPLWCKQVGRSERQHRLGSSSRRRHNLVPPTIPLPRDDWRPCPLPCSHHCKEQDMLSPPWPSLSGQTTEASLRFSVRFFSLSHLLSLCGFNREAGVSGFRTFPLAPFGEALSSSRHGPCDLTTAGAVNLPLWRRQSREEVRAQLSRDSLCSFSNNCLLCCLEVFVYVCWLMDQRWHLICVSNECHVQMSAWNGPFAWDVLFVSAHKCKDRISCLDRLRVEGWAQRPQMITCMCLWAFGHLTIRTTVV